MFLLAAIRERVSHVHLDFMHITPISPDQLDTLHGDMSSSVPLAACHRLVTQCPTLVYVLQALWLLNNDLPNRLHPVAPIFIQLLLGLSWDDLTTDLTVLRSLIGGAAQKQIDCAVVKRIIGYTRGPLGMTLSESFTQGSNFPRVSRISLEYLEMRRRVWR
ncbi:hypothetical protein C8R47DRAFT_751229 [Mycena vitilis]|nr:hypothetical protein C8R47DRAFT_751229 [Mycena vitilis]